METKLKEGFGEEKKLKEFEIVNEERKIYSNEEAVEEATKYFGGDNLAGTVWVNKYALKDSKEIYMKKLLTKCIGE